MPQSRCLLVVIFVVGWGGLLGCTDSPPPEQSGPPECATGRVSSGTADACVPARVRDVATDDADAETPLRKWGDTDGDEVFNHLDNCPEVANAEQQDADSDGIGDACDNYPGVANHDQANTESGDRGDACDEAADRYSADQNSDGDAHLDIDDNCPNVTNPDQTDTDGDGSGDPCDNCPETPNPTQTNSSGQGPGDVCAPEPAGEICREVDSDFERFTPNLYFLLDKSGSMKGNKMNDASRAIVEIANRYTNRAHFGLTAFASDCEPPELLAMGGHSPSAVQTSFDQVRAAGKTGAGGALESVRTEERFLISGESIDTERPRVVLIITDGDVNVCGGLSAATSEASSLLNNQNVETYVVGFQDDATPGNLDQLAQSGGTDHHRTASNRSELIATVDDILKRTIPCEFQLPEPQAGVDEHKIWVAIEGDYIDRGQYDFDPGSRTLSLGDQACETLRNAEDDPLHNPIEIVMGCPDDCESSNETCNYRDDDCDGEIDEGCEGCTPELCDGEDNDCDGETDEDCPDCQLQGETCTYDRNCCRGSCLDDNTCGEGCRPVGVECSKDGDCCSGTCAGQSGGQRLCTGS